MLRFCALFSDVCFETHYIYCYKYTEYEVTSVPMTRSFLGKHLYQFSLENFQQIKFQFRLANLLQMSTECAANVITVHQAVVAIVSPIAATHLRSTFHCLPSSCLATIALSFVLMAHLMCNGVVSNSCSLTCHTATH